MARTDTSRHYSREEVMGPVDRIVINVSSHPALLTLTSTYGKHAKGIRGNHTNDAVVYVKLYGFQYFIGPLKLNIGSPEFRGEIMAISSSVDGTGYAWPAEYFCVLF